MLKNGSTLIMGTGLCRCWVGCCTRHEGIGSNGGEIVDNRVKVKWEKDIKVVILS